MWAGLLDLLFPTRCAGCGSRGDPFCARCQERLHWILPPICARCGRPYLSFTAPITGNGEFLEPMDSAFWCPACRRCPPPFAVARSVAAYQGALKEAICALKFRRVLGLAAPLGRLLVEFAPPEALAGVDAVVPVPLHPRRLAERGFNQAELLARPVAEAIGVQCLSGAVRRVRQEAAQSELGAAERIHNVAGAFEPGDLQIGGTILLIDDVYSTGATAAACARTFRVMGACHIRVLTLARATLRREPPPYSRRAVADT